MYASSVVENIRDERRRFVNGVSEDPVKDYRAAMLNYNIDMVRFMLHAQLVEESRRKRRVNESKKPKIVD